VASSTVNLAGLYCLQGKYAEAEKLYLRALRIREKLFGADHPQVATSLHDMAELYLKTGRPARAVPLFERALAIHVQKSGRGSVDTWESLAGLAKARDDTGDQATAAKLYQEALAAIQSVAGRESVRCTAAMRDLAWFDARSGRSEDALTLAMEAETLSMEHARLLASSLPDQQALRYAAVRADGLHLALSMAAEDRRPEVAEQVWNLTVHSRALVLDEIAARRRALRYDDPEVQRIADAYAATSRRLAHLMLVGELPDNPEFSSQLAEARGERERSERELAAHSSAFRAMGSRRQIGLEEVRAALPPRSALVAFVRFERWSKDLGARGVDQSAIERGEVTQEYLAFVLPQPDAVAAAVPLGPATKIDQLIDAWSKSIVEAPMTRDRAAARAECRAVGAELRKLLWDPLADHVAGARFIFLVPDGAIHHVTFAALPIGEDRYLVEAEPILHYVGAERDLVPSESQGAGGVVGGLLAVGGPEFDGVGGVATGQAGTSPRFAPLPATIEEARSVTTMWQDAMAAQPVKASTRRQRGRDGAAILLTGKEATEGEVKRRAPGRQVLHLATHGFFLRQGRPLLPDTRGFGGVVIDDADVPAGPHANPLELSGLAFAGANRIRTAQADDEDGILTAEEIAAMNLTGTEWAVLSACETGVGAVQDVEGIVGMRRAFQVSGVRTLIMSLWPVDDRATRRWMEELYRSRLGNRGSTLEAVHEATLAVLSAQRAAGTEHPFFWGAFVAAGDWR
jgi:CHAT domain-containing protein/tetratricopeptide (TPR) repeat protein